MAPNIRRSVWDNSELAFHEDVDKMKRAIHVANFLHLTSRRVLLPTPKMPYPGFINALGSVDRLTVIRTLSMIDTLTMGEYIVPIIQPTDSGSAKDGVAGGSTTTVAGGDAYVFEFESTDDFESIEFSK